MSDFYFYYLSYIDGLSVAVKTAVLNDSKLAERLFYMDDRACIKKLLTDMNICVKEADYAAYNLADRDKKKMAEAELKSLGDIKFWDYFCKQYPEKLRHIYNPPLGLFVRGRLPDTTRPCLAVIGARECTEYGVRWTEKYTEELCKNNIQIISGMARGIDGVAGRTSVKYEGLSYAVLGSGINICYPECNRDLYSSLIKKGSLISEYPPSAKARPFRFPYRNRIISGLCDAVFVAEAAIKSGSHITAYLALEDGKDVFALPGSLDSKLSEGTNNLIKKGAFPALAPEDILQCLKNVY